MNEQTSERERQRERERMASSRSNYSASNYPKPAPKPRIGYPRAIARYPACDLKVELAFCCGSFGVKQTEYEEGTYPFRTRVKAFTKDGKRTDQYRVTVYLDPKKDDLGYQHIYYQVCCGYPTFAAAPSSYYKSSLSSSSSSLDDDDDDDGEWWRLADNPEGRGRRVVSLRTGTPIRHHYEGTRARIDIGSNNKNDRSSRIEKTKRRHLLLAPPPPRPLPLPKSSSSSSSHARSSRRNDMDRQDKSGQYHSSSPSPSHASKNSYYYSNLHHPPVLRRRLGGHSTTSSGSSLLPPTTFFERDALDFGPLCVQHVLREKIVLLTENEIITSFDDLQNRAETYVGGSDVSSLVLGVEGKIIFTGSITLNPSVVPKKLTLQGFSR